MATRPFSNLEIKALRSRLGLNQAEFADQYNIPIGSLRNWEQGRREPEAMAALFLQLIELDAETIRNLVAKLSKNC